MSSNEGTSLVSVLYAATEVLATSDQSAVKENSIANDSIEESDLSRLRHLLGRTCACRLPEDFLRKCLMYHDNDCEAASATALGFVRFRESAHWPLRIRACDVEDALRSEFHWLLWPPRSRMSDHNSSRPQFGDAGPAACLVFNMAKFDLRLRTALELQKMSMFLMERALDSSETQKRGLAVIVDFRGLQLQRFLSSVGIADIKRGALLWKGAFPCRLRRIWLIEPPTGLHFLITCIRRLLSPKVRERVRMTKQSSDMQALVEDLGSCIALPSSLGGHDILDWKAVVNHFVSSDATYARKLGYLEHLETHGMADAKRPGRDGWFSTCCCTSRNHDSVFD